jgi:hypothetical protein
LRTQRKEEDVETQDLKALIKESMREVLHEERLALCQMLAPYISQKEQAEIEADLGSSPEDEGEELTDMTDWVKYGN